MSFFERSLVPPPKVIQRPSRHPIHGLLPKISIAFFFSEPPSSKALRFEESVGAIFIVRAPALGALLGASDGSGKSVEVLLSNPKMIVLLNVLVAIFAPLAIWGSVLMNKVAFGKALDRLRRNIQALNENCREKVLGQYFAFPATGGRFRPIFIREDATTIR